MNERRGVVMVMFDLPVAGREDRRNYAQFRKAIITHGYRSFQKSVYIKLLRNISSASRELAWLDEVSPGDGSVQAMAMNLNAFRGLTAVRGQSFNMALFADDVIYLGTDGPQDAPEWDDEEVLRRSDELVHRIKGLDDDEKKAAPSPLPDDPDIYETDLF